MRPTAGRWPRPSMPPSSPGSAGPARPLVVGGDFNVAPADVDVYDPADFVGTTHTSAPERAAFQALLDWGLVGAFRIPHPPPRPPPRGAGGRFPHPPPRARPLHLVGLSRRQLP